MNRSGTRWIEEVRRWTLFNWMFLGFGILLGARWAYIELGWGGYWGWDPVENASLMPWLVGTAFLHSVMIEQRRGMLKTWNVVLIVLTFELSIFGTFLTRSGVLTSVHSFAESNIGPWFMGFILISATIATALILYRKALLESENRMDAVVSREGSFLFNNVLFVALTFATFLGTTFPVLSEAVTGEKISVSAPFFNRVNVPIARALLLLTGIGPVLSWKRATASVLKRNFLIPTFVGTLATLIGIPVGLHGVYPTSASSARLRHPRRSSGIRAGISGAASDGRAPGAVVHLIQKKSAATVHHRPLGRGVDLRRGSGPPSSRRKTTSRPPGRVMGVGPYRLTLLGVEERRWPTPARLERQ
jgi:cytochrome c-type biogenesis protein CcmF